MDEWLTVSAWGERMGLSRQAAYKAVHRCGIELADGRVHAVRATALYKAQTRPRVRVAGRHAEPGPTPPADSAARVSYDEARRRQAVAEALMAERAERVQAGELVEVAAVRREHGRRLTALRESLLQMPARLSAGLAAEGSQQGCHDLLQREVYAILEAVAGGPANG